MVRPVSHVSQPTKRAVTVAVLLLVALAIIAPQTRSAQEQSSAAGPKAQALKLYLVMQKQDWRALYFLIALSPNAKKDLPDDADAFAAGVRKGISDSDGQKVLDDLFNNMSDIAVGDPVMNGEKADVPTSCKITFNGKQLSFKGDAHMIKDQNIWKWDLTSSDDLQAATSTETQALIGKPTT